MSALLQFAAFNDDRLDTTNGFGAPDHYWNGLPFEADGTLAVTNGLPPSHYWQGLGFTDAGRLATATNGVFDHWQGGAAPMTSTGALIFRIGGIVAYANGIAYRSTTSIAFN